MPLILTEILIIAALLLVNGVFAMSEIAVVTSRRARLERSATDGSRAARAALGLVDEPTRFLSTVQIGITLIGVLAGAFGGATIADELDARLEVIPGLAPYSEVIALAVVVAGISFFSLVFGELVPKRIAMQAPERIAAVVAMPMQVLARLAAPLVWLLTTTTRAVLRLLGVSEQRATRVTEDEILAVIAEGRQSGAVHVAEHQMLEGVFRLGDRFVRDRMIPRPDVGWLEVSEGGAGLQALLQDAPAESMLVCRGSVDEVVGVVRPARVLSALLGGESFDLNRLTEPALFVPGSMEMLRLLEVFRTSQRRFAVVLDEYGGVEGTISFDEVLAEIVGDVSGSSVAEEAPIIGRADGTFLVDGDIDIDDVLPRFGVRPPPERERGSYRTIGGYLMARLGRVPRVADHVTVDGVRFEVVDMDNRRVDKVLVVPAAPPSG